MTALSTWTSGNTSVAAVGASGLATGQAAGTATMTATFEGVVGTVSYTVSSVTVDQLLITPDNVFVPVGDSAEPVAIDVLQADVTRCCGITGLLGVGALCTAHELSKKAEIRNK